MCRKTKRYIQMCKMHSNNVFTIMKNKYKFFAEVLGEFFVSTKSFFKCLVSFYRSFLDNF
jgi:hypothetical protein